VGPDGSPVVAGSTDSLAFPASPTRGDRGPEDYDAFVTTLPPRP
jgi:hypothetical protein